MFSRLEALKHRIHNFRMPIRNQKLLFAVKCCYFVTPIILGHLLMQVRTSRPPPCISSAYCAPPSVGSTYCASRLSRVDTVCGDTMRGDTMFVATPCVATPCLPPAWRHELCLDASAPSLVQAVIPDPEEMRQRMGSPSEQTLEVVQSQREGLQEFLAHAEAQQLPQFLAHADAQHQRACTAAPPVSQR